MSILCSFLGSAAMTVPVNYIHQGGPEMTVTNFEVPLKNRSASGEGRCTCRKTHQDGLNRVEAPGKSCWAWQCVRKAEYYTCWPQFNARSIFLLRSLRHQAREAESHVGTRLLCGVIQPACRICLIWMRCAWSWEFIFSLLLTHMCLVNGLEAALL